MNALYRGKRKDNKEWVYGMPHKDGYLTLIISEDIESWDTDYINPEWWWKVDPATVGQYTGLDDKNGVKIFAGDIVTVTAYSYTECENEYGGEILCSRLGLAICNPIENGAYEREYLLNLQGSFTTVYEVIGNIHDKEASE